jgi:hypothetical protein
MYERGNLETEHYKRKPTSNSAAGSPASALALESEGIAPELEGFP